MSIKKPVFRDNKGIYNRFNGHVIKCPCFVVNYTDGKVEKIGELQDCSYFYEMCKLHNEISAEPEKEYELYSLGYDYFGLDVAEVCTLLNYLVECTENDVKALRKVMELNKEGLRGWIKSVEGVLTCTA